MTQREVLCRRALVTGASTGIGRALAHLLAEKGVSLILTARHLEPLQSLQKELEGKVDVEILTADLSIAAERRLVIDRLSQKAPDLLINNAGWGYYGSPLDRPVEDSMNMIELNVCALVELTIHALSVWKQKNIPGIVMNVSSVAGFQIMPRFSVYAATKSFVNRFSESLDEEVREEGMRVLASCPGMVDTEFQNRAAGKKISKGEGYMTAAFAAGEIWKQICSGKAVRAFDWKYRVMIFLTQYVIPKSLMVKLLKSLKKFRRG